MLSRALWGQLGELRSLAKADTTEMVLGSPSGRGPTSRGDGLRAVGDGGKATPGPLHTPGTLRVVQVSVG